jgi:hypothetical protein
VASIVPLVEISCIVLDLITINLLLVKTIIIKYNKISNDSVGNKEKINANVKTSKTNSIIIVLTKDKNKLIA